MLDKRTAAQEAFKLALSMMLLFWLSLAMDWDQPSTGGLAVILISLATTGASLNKGLARIAGTVVGLAVGLLALSLFGQNPFGMLAFFCVYLISVSYIMQGAAAPYAWFVAGYLSLTIWSTCYEKGDMGQAAFHYATFRYLETTAGIVIYTVVSAVLWPKRAGDQLSAQGNSIWNETRKMLNTLRLHIEGEKPEVALVTDDLTTAVSTFSATLAAAYHDTESVRRRKSLWEKVRKGLDALTNSIERGSVALADCDKLDLPTCLPAISQACEELEKRFDAMAALWRGQATAAGEDHPAISLTVTSDGGQELTPADHATLRELIRHWSELDRISRQLAIDVETLHDAEMRGISAPGPRSSLFSFVPSWDAQRLLNACFPAVCLIVAWVFWYFVNPPGGPSIPSTVAAISLSSLLNRMNPIAMLVVLVVGIFLFVAPVYFWVMPSLDSGAALLALIFGYTFVFAYLGADKPALKTVPILLLVTTTGISNDQSYSLLAMTSTALLLLLTLSILAVVDMLWAPRRPELLLTISIRRFFRACADTVRRSGANKASTTPLLQRREIAAVMSGQVSGLAAKISPKIAPGNDASKVQRLTLSLQTLACRLEALQNARREAADMKPGTTGRDKELRHSLAERVTGILENWAKLGTSKTVLKPHDLSGLIRDFDQELEKTAESDAQASEENGKNHLAFVGSTHRLLQSIAETEAAITDLDWAKWTETRF